MHHWSRLLNLFFNFAILFNPVSQSLSRSHQMIGFTVRHVCFTSLDGANAPYSPKYMEVKSVPSLLIVKPPTGPLRANRPELGSKIIPTLRATPQADQHG